MSCQDGTITICTTHHDVRHPSSADWPPRRSLFGVQISIATCDEACRSIRAAIRRRESAVVSAFSVHALMEAAESSELCGRVNRFAMIVADGQPVRWAMNWLHHAGLRRNVRGSDLMFALCKMAAKEGIPIYLYGGSPGTLASLDAKLMAAVPGLSIAGVESPPFRLLSPQEDDAMVSRVNASGAGLVFIGLGCPKQDYFAAEHACRLSAVQVCVGAAFDFLAGTKSTAPEWMQRYGLEWAHRLQQEPRRLWKRYLMTNSRFIAQLAMLFIRNNLSLENLNINASVQGDMKPQHLAEEK